MSEALNGWDGDGGIVHAVVVALHGDSEQGEEKQKNARETGRSNFTRKVSPACCSCFAFDSAHKQLLCG